MLENRIIFIDRSICSRYVPDALRAAGETIEIHDDHFERNATDEKWLATIGRRGWIALTKDRAIGNRTLQRLMVAKLGVRLFVFVSGNMSGKTMAEAIVSATKKIHRLTARYDPPFIAKIYASGEVKLWKNREQLLKKLEQYKK